MNKHRINKILMPSILFIFIICIGAISATNIDDNTNITSIDGNEITSINDVSIDNAQSVSQDNNVMGAGEKTFTDLADMFENATDRVEITDDYKFVSGDDDQGIIIAKDNLVINGNGHTIDGDGQAKIFKITGNNIILKNIIIKNAFFEKTYIIKNQEILKDQQAGIIWAGENGTLEKVTIQNSYLSVKISLDPEYYAGSYSVKGASGLYWVGENGQIIDCVFTQNNQEHSGSNIDMGGALKIDGFNCTVKNSKFASNTALRGGAINIDVENATIDNCIFTDNNATTDVGGAIRSNAYYTTIINSTFNNNNAIELYGGAIYAGNYLNVKGSKFNNNTASTR